MSEEFGRIDVAPMAGVGTSHVDWPAILAGTVIAAATSLVATAFGSAIGFSLTSPYKGPRPEFFFPALALWLIWVTVSSFAAGGYVTGRLRRRVEDCTPHEVDVRDGAHGLIVWGLAVLLGAAIGSSGLADAVKGGAEVASRNVDLASPRQAYVDMLLRGDGELRETGRASAEPSKRGNDSREAARLNEEGLRRVLSEARANSAESSPSADEPTRRIVEGIVARAPDGAFESDDRKYLVNVIASRTRVSSEEAARRVDSASRRMKSDWEKEKALAEKTRKAGIIVAFAAAATLAVGAATAFAATRLGGRHRDENIDLSHLVRPYRTR